MKTLIGQGLLVLTASLALFTAALSQPVSANQANLSEVCGGQGRYLLGIPSWDRGLGSCEDIDYDQLLEGNKVKILINNLATIAVSLAALIAVAFVIVGGFLFVLSSGEPEKATNARKTIINALIGLVIAIMGRVITEIIYNELTTL